jgi:hypothetical protein
MNINIKKPKIFICDGCDIDGDGGDDDDDINNDVNVSRRCAWLGFSSSFREARFCSARMLSFLSQRGRLSLSRSHNSNRVAARKTHCGKVSRQIGVGPAATATTAAAAARCVLLPPPSRRSLNHHGHRHQGGGGVHCERVTTSLAHAHTLVSSSCAQPSPQSTMGLPIFCTSLHNACV